MDPRSGSGMTDSGRMKRKTLPSHSASDFSDTIRKRSGQAGPGRPSASWRTLPSLITPRHKDGARQDMLMQFIRQRGGRGGMMK